MDVRATGQQGLDFFPWDPLVIYFLVIALTNLFHRLFLFLGESVSSHHVDFPSGSPPTSFQFLASQEPSLDLGLKHSAAQREVKCLPSLSTISGHCHSREGSQLVFQIRSGVCQRQLEGRCMAFVLDLRASSVMKHFPPCC